MLLAKHSAEWFRKFKAGDFDIRNEERGRPGKKFEDAELQELLDEDATQTQQQLADRLNVTVNDQIESSLAAEATRISKTTT